MKENKDYLLLKWGTLKGWCFANSQKCQDLMKEYCEIGSSYSAMYQKDTPRQKEIILEMIDSINGPIQNDWTGEVYETKDAVKKYILEYGKE